MLTRTTVFHLSFISQCLYGIEPGRLARREQPKKHAWQDTTDFLEQDGNDVYITVGDKDAATEKVPFWQRILRRSGKYHDWAQKRYKLKPIYMQYWQPEIPCSVAYPLREVSDIAFKNFRRGDRKIKYFTSTLAYMMGIAILEKFERIEIYGFELADDIEYVRQKACAEFWIGVALAKGIEVYTPSNNQIMWSSLYGGNEQGAGW